MTDAVEDEIRFIASDEDSYTVNLQFNEMNQYLLKLKKFVCMGKLHTLDIIYT